MADNFKWSLKETLGLQVEALQMDLDIEREKVKRLEAELQKTQQDQINFKVPCKLVKSFFYFYMTFFFLFG